jgi:hypothetical protein
MAQTTASGLLTYLLIRQRSDEDFPNTLSVREAAMATKTRAKAKRKKMTVGKTARRRKTVKKTRTISKKIAKKTPPRRAARTKAKPAQPEAVKPPPSRPAEPTAVEQRIGAVTHYYGHLSVVAMQLEPGSTLRVGDVVHIRGHTTDFTQKVESLEVNHAPVTEVAPNDDFGLRVVEHAREHDIVYKVRL